MMLVSMSMVAMLGLPYPRAMLLFAVGWKLTWLGVVALSLWRHSPGGPRSAVLHVKGITRPRPARS